jgi:hypothetical protein
MGCALNPHLMAGNARIFTGKRLRMASVVAMQPESLREISSESFSLVVLQADGPFCASVHKQAGKDIDAQRQDHRVEDKGEEAVQEGQTPHAA